MHEILTIKLRHSFRAALFENTYTASSLPKWRPHQFYFRRRFIIITLLLMPPLLLLLLLSQYKG
jgi:hypothetical protein